MGEKTTRDATQKHAMGWSCIKSVGRRKLIKETKKAKNIVYFSLNFCWQRRWINHSAKQCSLLHITCNKKVSCGWGGTTFCTTDQQKELIAYNWIVTVGSGSEETYARTKTYVISKSLGITAMKNRKNIRWEYNMKLRQ